MFFESPLPRTSDQECCYKSVLPRLSPEECLTKSVLPRLVYQGRFTKKCHAKSVAPRVASKSVIARVSCQERRSKRVQARLFLLRLPPQEFLTKGAKLRSADFHVSIWVCVRRLLFDMLSGFMISHWRGSGTNGPNLPAMRAEFAACT